MIVSHFLMLGPGVSVVALVLDPACLGGVLLAGAMASVLACMIAEGAAASRRILAGVQRDGDGRPKVFTLSFGNELVVLHPGKPWVKADEYKWVTRGLIEPPQSFHVLPHGAVEINGEKITLEEREGEARLEHEINKRHVAAAVHKAPASHAGVSPARAAGPAAGPRKVQFHVKVDSLGHLTVECRRGEEVASTGLRGLSALVANGLMLKPNALHVDALQRGLELDGVWYECSEAGARQLEQTLNASYAPIATAEHESAIEIKENPAAATGFDIRFLTVKAGARLEVKGHLSQEKLDILQDQAKCDLLYPGILLRLSPPNLLIRRRRPDGGEEHLPELPDLQYRRASAAELQELLNHPLIRRTAGSESLRAAAEAAEPPAALCGLEVTLNPDHPTTLWMECRTTRGGPGEGRAFTHHNIADLQEAGVFLPHLDVILSLDHRALGILDKQTGREQKLILDLHSPPEDLREASRLLTAALKPPPREALEPPRRAAEPAPRPPAPVVPPAPPRPVSIAAPAAPPRVAPPAAVTAHPSPYQPVAAPPRASAPPIQHQPGKPPLASSAVAPPRVEPAVPAHPLLACFRETDPVRVNTSIFERLRSHLGLPLQDVRLTLPRAFENRQFEVLSFSHPEIISILDLRCEEFHGFYLSHINEQKILLVFAHKGKHLEWGPQRCLLQAAVSAEADEFRASGLLGLAEDHNRHYTFIVTPDYRQWAKAREKPYHDIFVHFLTPEEFATDSEKYTLLWPHA
jgi:hypothetical protein